MDMFSLGLPDLLRWQLALLILLGVYLSVVAYFCLGFRIRMGWEDLNDSRPMIRAAGEEIVLLLFIFAGLHLMVWEFLHDLLPRRTTVLTA